MEAYTPQPLFEFATATRIIFGCGTLQQLPELAAGMGRSVLLATGSRAIVSDGVLAQLAARGLQVELLQVHGEPTLSSVAAAAARARAAKCDVVIGIGGGSVLDTAKAVAALLTNSGDLLDYVEVAGGGRPLANPAVACIAVPTAAGTGAEVTRNSVMSVPAQNIKVSLRSAFLLPRVALVDPQLTLGLPPAITASTGMDALTQLLEPYVSPRANPLTDALVRMALPRAARSLQAAWHNGANLAAREEMALASVCGGLALANARLGAVHGLAAVLGGRLPAAHGSICARLLPLVMSANVHALQQRAPHAPALQRYAEVAQWLTGSPQAQPADGAAWVAALAAEMGIAPLAAHGLTPALIPELVAKAQASSSMQGNSLPLSDAELAAILHLAL